MLFQQDSWRTAMQDVAAEIDATMGEYVIVTPINAATSKPNFTPEVQPERAVRAIAVFTSEAKQAFDSAAKGRRVGNGFEIAPLVSTSEPVFSFSYGATPFPLHQGCRIKRECSGEEFEVTDVRPDSVSRTACKVVQLGRQSGWR